MIIWINGAFGAGKTQTAYELNRRIENSFVYDPENLGSFISENIPETMKKDDFQDYEMWRKLNFQMIKDIHDKYDGILIIPMTIVNVNYFNEIIGSLRECGIDVRHYTLMTSKQTLLERLKSRGHGADSWAANQIDRCLEGLSNKVFQHHIDTENISIDDVVGKIVGFCKLNINR